MCHRTNSPGQGWLSDARAKRGCTGMALLVTPTAWDAQPARPKARAVGAGNAVPGPFVRMGDRSTCRELPVAGADAGAGAARR
jgi:hypothetical protein